MRKAARYWSGSPRCLLLERGSLHEKAASDPSSTELALLVDPRSGFGRAAAFASDAEEELHGCACALMGATTGSRQKYLPKSRPSPVLYESCSSSGLEADGSAALLLQWSRVRPIKQARRVDVVSSEVYHLPNRIIHTAQSLFTSQTPAFSCCSPV